MAQHHRTLPSRSSTRPGTLSATQTQTETPVLRLRATQDGDGRNVRPRIQWAEDVIDNEGLGRKKSKVCCIYHAPRQVGESSSSESSSSESSDNESEGGRSDDGRAQMIGKGKRRKMKKDERPTDGENDATHEHNHEGCENTHHTTQHTKAGTSTVTSMKKKSRNAYETQPKLPKSGKSTEVKS